MKPQQLECGKCGAVVFQLGEGTYDPTALRQAVDRHQVSCTGQPKSR